MTAQISFLTNQSARHIGHKPKPYKQDQFINGIDQTLGRNRKHFDDFSLRPDCVAEPFEDFSWQVQVLVKVSAINSDIFKVDQTCLPMQPGQNKIP